MTEIYNFDISYPDNVTESCRLILAESNDENLVILTMVTASVKKSYKAASYFMALRSLRLDLEQTGGIIQCNGADKQVFPSPMQLSFGSQKAYSLTLGQQTRLTDCVDIFETDKNNLTCVTVQEQENFYDQWFVSLRGNQ